MNSAVDYYRSRLSAELEAAQSAVSEQEEEEHRRFARLCAEVLRALEPTAGAVLLAD
jgi:hypothetical protein